MAPRYPPGTVFYNCEWCDTPLITAGAADNTLDVLGAMDPNADVQHLGDDVRQRVHCLQCGQPNVFIIAKAESGRMSIKRPGPVS